MTGQPLKAFRCWHQHAVSETKNCPLPPGHAGDHHHEYTAHSWPANQPTADSRPRPARARRR